MTWKNKNQYHNNRVRVVKSFLYKKENTPQAIELEEVVLGAMMIDKKGVDTVIDILSPAAFYKQAHYHIFEAIVHLFSDSSPIDLLTVSTQLRKNDKLEQIGGDFYLIQLTQKFHLQLTLSTILE